MSPAPRIGSLFTGYGGLDMGVDEALGGQAVWHVEFDAAPSRILNHHWPDVPNFGDVTAVDWAGVPTIDILTAGYPCQPFSTIGKRKGERDDRHLWPYVGEAIRRLRPGLAVLENVAGHLSLGIDRVLGDLAEAGYDTDWICLPASAAGAPHRRERVFIAAYPADKPWWIRYGDHLQARGREDRHHPHAGEGRAFAASRVPPAVWGKFGKAIRRWEAVVGRPAPWPGHPGGGVTTDFTEWLMGLPAGHVTDAQIALTREQQARALGNGVVLQQAALAIRTLANQAKERAA